MSRERTFNTSLVWYDVRGNEIEAQVKVTYAYYPGFAGDQIDPPESASVEINKIVGETEIPHHFFEDADLIAECFENEAGEIAAAEEYRAEQRREDSLMGWLA